MKRSTDNQGIQGSRDNDIPARCLECGAEVDLKPGEAWDGLCDSCEG